MLSCVSESVYPPPPPPEQPILQNVSCADVIRNAQFLLEPV